MASTTFPFQDIHRLFVPNSHSQSLCVPLKLHLTQTKVPAILHPRPLETDELALIARHKTRWIAKMFPGQGSRLHERLSSPFKAGIRYGLLGGVLGLLTGFLHALSKYKEITLPLKIPALLLSTGMAIVFGSLGYLSRRRRNEETIWLMRSLPYKDACIGDTEQLPIRKAELDRQAWIRAARTASSSLASTISTMSDSTMSKKSAEQKLHKTSSQLNKLLNRKTDVLKD